MKVTASGVVPVRRGRVLAGGPVRRRGVPLVLAASAVVACAGLLIGTGVAPAAAGARGAVLRVHWGRAAEVPGLGTLNVGGNAQVLSVSCWRAGDCAAGGFYTDASQHQQAFVVDETNGRWREAEEVPGSAELNAGGGAQVLSVSCPPGGECAAGGYYSDRGGNQQAFVVNEKNGRWRRAEEIPGTAKLNAGGFARVLSVSCPSAGNCGTGGWYQNHPRLPGSGYNSFEAFVASEKNGRWANAEEVSGLAALNTTYFPDAWTSSVSCAWPGNCTAGGFYYDVHAGEHPFVVSEKNGRWGRLARPSVGGAVSRCRAGGPATARLPGRARPPSALLLS